MSAAAATRRNHAMSHSFSRAFRCSAILRYAQPKPGDFVLDPVCGSGATLFTPTLPIDMALFALFACDIDDGADGDVFKALGNYNENTRVRGGVINCDLNALPLRCASVDIVVADLPYGQKCSKWNQIRGL